ncbi:MAG: TetR/AcrR family transcriptional regulator C-terminal domain-containing protein [Butyrivibrio sp.]|nr:TetR/AcrR family transcriptional regulator C-terminal domain-containing protein [Butyrivibrio sp.]
MADSNITKNALASSLRELMKEKPFEKISISDICDLCGMNRKSFYYHFKDKYDLVNWIYYVNFIGQMDINSFDNGWDMIEYMSRKFYEDKEFYIAALKIEGQNSFREYVLETLRPLTDLFVKDVYKEVEHREFFITFMCDAFITSIMRWLSEGMIMEPGDFLEELHSVILEMAKKVIEDERKLNE